MHDIRSGAPRSTGCTPAALLCALATLSFAAGVARGSEPAPPLASANACQLAEAVTPLAALTQPIAPPDLYPAYQINLELIDLLGGFFHRSSGFPEVRELTDITAVKLAPWLETSEQTNRDFNLFVLDARMGSIIHSLGMHGLEAFRDPTLTDAREIAVLANGRIGVVTRNGQLDDCYRFDGDGVARLDSCEPSALAVRSLSAHGGERFVVLTQTGELMVIEPETGRRWRVQLAAWKPKDLTLIRSDGTTLALVDRGGSRLGLFVATGKGGPEGRSGKEVFRRIARLDELRVPLPEGGLSEPFGIADVIVNHDGFVYLLIPDHDVVVILDPELRPSGYSVPRPMPIPFRQLSDVNGLTYHPESGLLHVFSYRTVSAYSEHTEASDFVLRHTPAELVPVRDAIGSIPIDTFDPLGDLFEHPNVRPVLDGAFQQLAGNSAASQ